VPIDKSITACFYYPKESGYDPYNKVTDYILELKRESRVADVLACAMALVLIHEIDDVRRIRLIIPVPKHKDEVRERGFNQAAELARRLAEVLRREFNHNVPVVEDLVIKVDPRKRRDIREGCESKHQNDRQGVMRCECEETRKLYEINKSALRRLGKLDEGDIVLIVDDVRTKGVTASVIAELLRSVTHKASCYLLTVVRDYYQKAVSSVLPPPWLWEDYGKARLRTGHEINELALIHYAWVNWDKVKKRVGLDTTIDVAEKVLNGEKFVELLRNAYLSDDERQEAVEEVSRVLNYGVRLIPMDSPEYPKYLRVYGRRENKVYPPLLLYHLGQPLNWDEIKPVAVVGTRKPSQEGEELTREIVRELVKRGYTIVTGLAEGVDMVATEETLNAGGRVIGVIPYMVESRDNYTLYLLSKRDNIAEGLLKSGAVISENLYKGLVKNQLAARNRITAGSSIAVIIPETKYKKEGWGTKYQVQYGLNAGRRVIIFKPRVNDKEVVEGFEYFKNARAERRADIVESIDDMLSILKKAEEELMNKLGSKLGKPRSGKITDFL
jgi:DNA processing protein